MPLREYKRENKHENKRVEGNALYKYTEQYLFYFFSHIFLLFTA